jgi:hypothetical protein
MGFHNFYVTRLRMPKPLDITAEHLSEEIYFLQIDVDKRQAYWTPAISENEPNTETSRETNIQTMW